ncbi:hypothetical protein IQ07DRAFT_581713 [Pyrenochaeta sp. DS3sAY3a]|nr:hypothetical protein IQ07DRAFT_581713 [Pyrenochaeta sp. DS3sAY3a]
MPTLLTIPLELLVSISSFLPTQDLASLRLTCNQIERSLYEWFSKEFFTKKQFMLTHPSLQTLIDISKHASFSQKLTHVIIGTNIYEDIPMRFRDSQAATKFIQGLEDQRNLMSIGLDREMLTEAFERLVNLNTVGIRDFHSTNRIRDGERASWSSWGAPTVYRETGVQLQFGRQSSSGFGGFGGTAERNNFPARVFSTLLHALGKAGRTPSEVEVLLRISGLPDYAFSLPNYLLPTADPILQSLTTLLLNVNLNPQSYHTHSNGNPCDPNAGRALRHFLSHTPNLKHLRLNFEKHMVAHNAQFLQWLSEPVPDTSSQTRDYFDPAPIALPFLKQLNFGQLIVVPAILTDVITKFASTLEDLSLWRMGLDAHALPPPGHKPNYWADVFTKLSTIPQLELTHLMVGMLQQDHLHVGFKQEGDDKAPRLLKREYSGKKMDKFLEEISRDVSVDWPERPSVLPFEDEDEEMADEDEEEEDEDEDDEDDDEA